MNYSKHSCSFLRSALVREGHFIQNENVMKWLAEQNNRVSVRVNKVSFRDMSGWIFADTAIRHESGRFFSIEGIRINTNWGSIPQWDQPIINQPEIGYLGFIAKEFRGVLHFLVQAKIEPGNVNHVQLSPTLQATRSNYSQVHKGRKPLYLEYFRNARPDQIMVDQLQSEQGARFLKKRNRNIIIRLEEDIPLYENFVWLTLGQIKRLMQFDNLVNMDTRTVISGVPFGQFEPEVIDIFNFIGHQNEIDEIQGAFLRSALSTKISLHSFENIIAFLTQLKCTYDLHIHPVPLVDLHDWVVDEEEIYNTQRKYFKIIGVDVEIGNREVVTWSQPMVEPAQEGLCAFVCKKINGLLHFAVQAKLECGNHDIIEFAPTVQCLTGNYRQTPKKTLPFLDYVLNAPPDNVLFDCMQSEEGGRFYKEQNRNMIVMAGDEIPVELPERYIWMTLNQLYKFLIFNNYLNIQARSLIAAISFI